MKSFGTYDDKTLKKLQKVETEMLKDINKVCEKYKIKYFALDGTGIGAIRHKGFIPWDDDIDLRFMADDLEKFVKCMEKEMPEKYYFINENTYKNYPLFFTKMCKKDTIFVGYDAADLGIENGIFIDMFPMYFVDDDEKKHKRKLSRSWYIHKLGTLASIKDPVLYFDGLKAKLTVAICYIVHYVLRLFGLTSGKIYRFAKKITIAKEKTNTIALLNSLKRLTNIYRYDDVFPVVKKDFEDTYIYMPKNYDKLLRLLFGDYMQLPPEDMRHNHFPKKLVFDTKKEKNK